MKIGFKWLMNILRSSLCKFCKSSFNNFGVRCLLSIANLSKLEGKDTSIIKDFIVLLLLISSQIFWHLKVSDVKNTEESFLVIT